MFACFLLLCGHKIRVFMKDLTITVGLYFDINVWFLTRHALMSTLPHYSNIVQVIG